MDMGRGTRASAGWKQTEKLLFSHCSVPSRSLWALALYSKITSNFTEVDGVTVLFQLAAAAEDPAIRTALSPLPASLWRSSRDINPSLGTAIRSQQTERGRKPRISPQPHNSSPACAGSRRCSHKRTEACCLAFVPH